MPMDRRDRADSYRWWDEFSPDKRKVTLRFDYPEMDDSLTEEEVDGILDFYKNTLDETGQNEFNKMSITKIQSTMKKLGL